MKSSLSRAIALSALITPTAAYALGLGDIRLNSALNQPFDAEIELVAATPEDLAALRAALASSDTFGRYGLEKPAYLADFAFRVARGNDGRDVLRVSSPRPVTEPFVTLLVEASWPRGRLLREYTVLLDPPVFAAAPAAVAAPLAAPVAAPIAPPIAAAQAAQPPFSTEPPATDAVAAAPIDDPTPAVPQVPREALPAQTPQRGGSYRVQPNDTLWRIASGVYPGSRADVNQAMVAIYRNNQGAFDGNINVLRSGAELQLPDSAEVSAIPAQAAADEVARQYRLWQQGPGVSSNGDSGRLRLVTPQQGGSSASTTARDAGATASPGLEARVQQLETELAEARRLIEVQSAELATLQGRAQSPASDATLPRAGQPAPTVAAGIDADTAAVESPVVEAPEPQAAQPPAARPQPKPRPVAGARDEATPSLISRLTGYWWALAAALAALLAGLAMFLRRRRAADQSDDALEHSFSADEPAARRDDEFSRTDILVEERRPLEPAIARVTAPVAVPAMQAAETDQPAVAAPGDASDPLAEADFHMAYGLYDQAADLVRSALRREPARHDLKLKLLEIFFVWGNRERFLDIARDIESSRGAATVAPDWDKVLIMGRQIAPEDVLFSAAPGTSSDLDLDLELATTSGDVDGFASAHSAHTASLPDLDPGATSPRVENDSGIDFVLDEPGRGADADLAKLAPTVEMPRPALGESSPQAAPARRDFATETTPAEGTDELSIDRLGIEIEAMAALGELDKSIEDEVFGADTESDDALLARLDATQLAPGRTQRSLDATAEDLLSSTAMMKMQTGTAEALTVIVEAEAEGTLDRTDYQVELPTIETPRIRNTDETLLASEMTAYSDVSFPLTADESSTLSEVGTKLDLARAYIDMGDPEGARSILDEVVDEGSSVQQQEAQRLIAALP